MAYKKVSKEEFEQWAAQNPGAMARINGQETAVPMPQAKDLGFIGNLLRTVSKPIRTVASMPEYLMQALQAANNGQTGMNPGQYKSIFLTPEEEIGWERDPVKQGAKASAGLASYLLPVGAAKGVTGLKAVGQAAGKGIAPGMLSGLSFSEEGKELEGTLMGGGTGALFSGLLQGVGEVGRGIKAAKLSNKLDDMADELQASALKKDIGIAPTVKQGKNTLPKEVLGTANKLNMKIKSPEDLKAFGKTLYESNANIANQAAQQLDDLGRMVDITPVKQPLIEQLAKTQSEELRIPLQKALDSIDNATGGTNVIPASKLLGLRREWGKLGNWNPFMDPSATTTAGAFNAAYLKANDVLDDAFKSAGITGFKEANKALSLSIDADNWAERAIANKSAKPIWNDMTQDAAIAATVFGGGGLGAVVGAVGSKLMQRYAEPMAGKALRGASKITSGAGTLPKLLQPLVTAGQRLTPVVAGLAGGSQMQQPQEQQTQQQLPQGVDGQGISALNMMLAQEVLNGNISATEANAVLSLLGMDQKKEASQGQVDAQNAVDMVGRLSSSLSGRQLTGPLKGLMGLNPYATEQQDMQAEIDLARQVVGKFLEGGILRKEDEEKYKKILPTMYDTQEVAQRKLENLVIELQNRQKQYQQTGYAGYGSSANDESLYNAGY